MQRVCFLLHIRPERLDEYVGVHREVWPEMLRALSRCGWSNYSLFLRAEDGLVVGYFETDDPAEAFRGMDVEPVNTRWQETMAPYFAAPAAGRTPGQSERLVEYFHLD